MEDTLLDHKYILGQHIGSGSFAIVFDCIHIPTNIKYAVKTPPKACVA